MVRKAEKTARKKAGIPKPYNSGQWTEARYHSFVKGALRAASRRWPPKYEALRRACVGKRHDPATGKQSFRYTCAGCANIFKAAEISVELSVGLATFSLHAIPATGSSSAEQAAAEGGMKKGGKVKKMAKGGSVGSASKRADGCAQRGKTKGRIV
jgi:hypothetical protein